MLNKPGILDLVIAACILGIAVLAGDGGAAALTLIAGLHAFVAIAALLVNIACLNPLQRLATLRVVIAPYSAFTTVLVLAFFGPAIDHFHAHQCAHQKAPSRNDDC